ncbi:hypothetical protein BDV96DRAFT_604604 [Lophiotrema nucula]|uniref:Uncharacterized protein n=1 Tax=Lophiotrema nucula TaxID=690887 RepID=A0A6A5YRU4_9PLEO|nr:hypothetical protein BDV96DRAFT_604604 [Lophiotrema nucula]
MDLVKLMNRTKRNGQIGDLNAKVELIKDSTKTAPIFEFRDLDQAKGSELETRVGSYEAKVEACHKQFKCDLAESKVKGGKAKEKVANRRAMRSKALHKDPQQSLVHVKSSGKMTATRPWRNKLRSKEATHISQAIADAPYASPRTGVLILQLCRTTTWYNNRRTQCS